MTVAAQHSSMIIRIDQCEFFVAARTRSIQTLEEATTNFNNKKPQLLTGKIPNNMSQLTFQACVFSGVVCGSCGAAFDNVNMYPAKLRHHQIHHHPDMELNARNELNRVKDIFKDAAKCLAVYSTDNEKAQFCEMFLVRKTAVWCSHGSCNRAYMDSQSHCGNDRAQHREDGHFSNRLMKCPLIPPKKKVFFAEDEWNFVSYKSKFSKIFKRSITSLPQVITFNPQLAPALQLQIRNRNRMTLPMQEGDPFQVDADTTREILQAFCPVGSSRMPKVAEEVIYTAEGQQREVGLETCFEIEEEAVKSFDCFEIEHIAAKTGDHSKLLLFESEVGMRAYVAKAFQGSYAKFAQHASVYTSPPSSALEKCLQKAFFQFFYLGNQQIGCLSPDLRSQLMTVGDGTASRLLSKIIQRANEEANAMDNMDEENEEVEMEMDAHGFERKEQYETFYKDVMELVGDMPILAGPTCSQ